jgi:hypothetical protein
MWLGDLHPQLALPGKVKVPILLTQNELMLDRSRENTSRKQLSPLTEKLVREIRSDDRISSSYQPSLPPTKRRAPDLIHYLVENNAYHSQSSGSDDTVGVGVAKLKDIANLDVKADMLRSDLETLEECGYLHIDTSTEPYQYTIAEAWVPTDCDIDDLPTESKPTLPGNQANPQPNNAQPEPQVERGATNYEYLSGLEAYGLPNLTAGQQQIVPIAGRGGLLVVVLGVALAFGGQRMSPHLAAAGESFALAGVTLLFGWLSLLVAGSCKLTESDSQPVPPS